MTAIEMPRIQSEGSVLHIICCIVALTKMLWIQYKGSRICTSFSTGNPYWQLDIHIVVNLKHLHICP